MEFTWKRTLSSIFIFVSLSDVLVQGGPIPFPSSLVDEVNNVCSNGNLRPPRSQLMNPLYTRSANGVLPDLLPTFRTTSMFQGQRQPDFLLEELRQRPPIVDVPSSQGSVVAPDFYSEIPCPSPPQPYQGVPDTYLPPGLSPTMIPSLAHDLNQMPVLPPSPPLHIIMPLQTYSFPQPGIGFASPLQPQPISDDSYPITTPELSEVNPSIQIYYDTSPAAEVTMETFDYATENTMNEFQTTLLKEDSGQLPISLQINITAENTPAPRVTVLTSTPPAPAPAPQNEYLPPYMMYPPPMPPIILESSRSKLKNWLPILMIGLLNGRRQGRSGNGYCGCGRPCNCRNSNISTPYPIPIPTNNPVVSSSRPRSPPNRGRCDGLNVNNKQN